MLDAGSVPAEETRVIGIVTARGDSDPCCYELMQAATRRGGGAYIDPLSLSIDLCHSGQVLAGDAPADRFDALILRGLNHQGEVDLQFEIFELLEARGMPILNSSRAVSLAESKPVSLQMMRAAGIPIPRTLACQTKEPLREALREFGTAVIKPLYGALGIGVERIHWPDDENRIGSCLEEWGALCIQEYIDSGGEDIRAFLVGGTVFGAVKRIAQNGEWRTNVHQGGHCIPYELTGRENELCRSAARLLGLEYTGIDILHDASGPLLLEVNGAPQWQGLAAATGLDVAGAVVDRALTLAKR